MDGHRVPAIPQKVTTTHITPGGWSLGGGNITPLPEKSVNILLEEPRNLYFLFRVSEVTILQSNMARSSS